MFALVAMNSISKRTECMDTLILDDKFCLVFAYLCVRVFNEKQLLLQVAASL